MGADVTHPTQGSDDSSYAAVVSSIDTYLTSKSWRTECRIQKGGVEYIRDLKEITNLFLKMFAKEMNALPETIIMIRDGVGEGQFIPVLQKEVRDMKAACQEIKPGYNPRLTFLVS